MKFEINKLNKESKKALARTSQGRIFKKQLPFCTCVLAFRTRSVFPLFQPRPALLVLSAPLCAMDLNLIVQIDKKRDSKELILKKIENAARRKFFVFVCLDWF